MLPILTNIIRSFDHYLAYDRRPEGIPWFEVRRMRRAWDGGKSVEHSLFIRVGDREWIASVVVPL